MKKVQNVVPRKIPFKCVVCNGFGTLKFGKIKCHACKGRGYILVNNSDREIDDNKNTVHRDLG